MFASALNMNVVYLLATAAFAAIPSILVVALIASPAVWSRDPARRARARCTLRLLGQILVWRRKTLFGELFVVLIHSTMDP